MAVNNVTYLINRLKKCCCNRISYREDPNNWYMIELIYNKRYYRFFALTFDKLEQQSLREMRILNWWR